MRVWRSRRFAGETQLPRGVSRAKRLAWVLGVVVMAGLWLQGCGTAWLYNRADRLVLGEINREFNTASAQKKVLAPAVRRYMAWHRSEVLPRWERDLSELKRRLLGDFSEADFDWAADFFERELQALLARARPELVGFLASLRSDQIALSEKRRQEENERLTEEAGEPGPERIKVRGEKLLEWFDDWCDGLSDEQAAAITRLNAAVPDGFDGWMARRRARRGLLGDLDRAKGLPRGARGAPRLGPLLRGRPQAPWARAARRLR